MDVRFEGAVPVHLSTKAASSIDSTIGHVQEITIKVAIQSKSPNHPELLIRLTDEQDYFFLYSLEVSEEDFSRLKREQDIKVDFASFPGNFIELLQKCREEATSPVPKFLAQLEVPKDRGAASLNIIETNNFKNLTHLSLSVVPGNDDTVKRYLAGRVKECIQTNEETLNEFHTVKSSLETKVGKLETELNQQTQLYGEAKRSVNSIKLQYEKELATFKEQATTAQTASQNKIVRENEAKLQAASGRATEIQKKLDALTEEHAKVTRERYSLEGQVRELQLSLQTTTTTLEMRNQEIDTVKTQLNEIFSQKGQTEKVLTEENLKSLRITQELEMTKERVIQLEEKLKSALEARDSSRESMARLQATNEGLEAKLKAVAEEIGNRENATSKLHKTLRSYKSKVSARNGVIVQQENLVQAHEKTIATLQEKVKSLEGQMRETNVEASRAKNELEVAQKELDERGKLLKNNENVIAWLNKQLSEASLTKKSSLIDHISSVTQASSYLSERQRSKMPFGSSMANSLNARKVIYNKGETSQPSTSTPITTRDAHSPLDPKYLSPVEDGQENAGKSRSRLPVRRTPPSHGPKPNASDIVKGSAGNHRLVFTDTPYSVAGKSTLR